MTSKAYACKKKDLDTPAETLMSGQKENPQPVELIASVSEAYRGFSEARFSARKCRGGALCFNVCWFHWTDLLGPSTHRLRGQ